jgi:hypothetical protein
MSKADNIEILGHYDALNSSNTYDPPIPSRKLTHNEKWMPVISLGCLPFACAVIFAVQGSPRVLQWIIRIINSLF